MKNKRNANTEPILIPYSPTSLVTTSRLSSNPTLVPSSPASPVIVIDSSSETDVPKSSSDVTIQPSRQSSNEVAGAFER